MADAMKHVTGLGYVESDCPIGFWPEKGYLWKRGFCDGWAEEKKAEPTTVASHHDGEYGDGHRQGRLQFMLAKHTTEAA